MSKDTRGTSRFFKISCALALAFLWGANCKCIANLLKNADCAQWNGGPAGWGWTYNVGCGGNATTGWMEVWGTLFQDIPTIPGERYHLHFEMAGNFNVGATHILHTFWGDSSVGSSFWTPSGASINDLRFVSVDFDLVASNSSTRLLFMNPFQGTQIVPRITGLNLVAVAAPEISCPVDLSQCNDKDKCTAIVNEIDPVITDNGGISVTYGLTGATTGSGNGSASGLVFGYGVTTVTYTATTDSGGEANCSFTVTINDCEAPSVSCVPGPNPADGTIPAASSNSKSGKNAHGFYQLLATDNCDGGVLPIFIKDSEQGPCGGTFSAGPYLSGTKVKLTRSPGKRRVETMAGDVVAHINTQGAPLVVVADSAGNATCHVCLVPPIDR